MKSLSVNIQMKAIGHFCGTVYSTVQGVSNITFRFVNEILQCDRSNKTYWPRPHLRDDPVIFSRHQVSFLIKIPR